MTNAVRTAENRPAYGGSQYSAACSRTLATGSTHNDQQRVDIVVIVLDHNGILPFKEGTNHCPPFATLIPMVASTLLMTIQQVGNDMPLPQRGTYRECLFHGRNETVRAWSRRAISPNARYEGYISLPEAGALRLLERCIDSTITRLDATTTDIGTAEVSAQSFEEFFTIAVSINDHGGCSEVMTLCNVACERLSRMSTHRHSIRVSFLIICPLHCLPAR